MCTISLQLFIAIFILAKPFRCLSIHQTINNDRPQHFFAAVGNCSAYAAFWRGSLGSDALAVRLSRVEEIVYHLLHMDGGDIVALEHGDKVPQLFSAERDVGKTCCFI